MHFIRHRTFLARPLRCGGSLQFSDRAGAGRWGAPAGRGRVSSLPTSATVRWATQRPGPQPPESPLPPTTQSPHQRPLFNTNTHSLEKKIMRKCTKQIREKLPEFIKFTKITCQFQKKKQPKFQKCNHNQKWQKNAKNWVNHKEKCQKNAQKSAFLENFEKCTKTWKMKKKTQNTFSLCIQLGITPRANCSLPEAQNNCGSAADGESLVSMGVFGSGGGRGAGTPTEERQQQ